MDPSPPSATPSVSPNGPPAEDSSPGSPTASAPASKTPSRAAAGVFIADPGPPFDARAAAAAPPPDPVGEPLPLLMWEEDTVRGVLTAQGAALHLAVGVGEQDWKYLEGELDTICGPLTRILNHYPATQALAAGGDAIAASIGLGAYGLRSILERRAVLAARQAAAEPVTGVPAAAGSDGARDPAQQAARGEQPEWTVGE
jgi:hypothetical protein